MTLNIFECVLQCETNYRLNIKVNESFMFKAFDLDLDLDPEQRLRP